MENKIAILINPGYYFTIRPRKHAVAPFGLLSLAAVLEENGFGVELWDFEFMKIKQVKHFLKKLPQARERYLFFGISLLTGPGFKKSLYVVKTLKAKFGDSVKIVAGGPHATIFSDELLKVSPIDIVVLGEGEDTVVDLARHIDAGKPFNGVNGIQYRDKGIIFKTPERRMIEDISALPGFAWEKIDVKRYIWDERLTIIHSRGCPFRCTFCLSKKFLGDRPRTRKVGQVIEEFLKLEELYGIKKFSMVDDLPFAGSIALLKEFCQELIDKKINLQWELRGRINNFTPEMASMIKDVGCQEIHFGIESGSQRILDAIKKDMDLSAVKEKIEICHNIGIRCSASFIVGFPFEQKQDLVKTRKLISYLCKKGVGCAVHRLTPFPSTQIWQDCVDKGLNMPKTLKDWEDYGRQLNLFRRPLIKLERSVRWEIYRIGLEIILGRLIRKCFSAANKLLKGNVIKIRGSHCAGL